MYMMYMIYVYDGFWINCGRRCRSTYHVGHLRPSPGSCQLPKEDLGNMDLACKIAN